MPDRSGIQIGRALIAQPLSLECLPVLLACLLCFRDNLRPAQGPELNGFEQVCRHGGQYVNDARGREG